ncbi:hypothetical protein BDN70DRAFT_887615, partial [Pholiota conissans]
MWTDNYDNYDYDREQKHKRSSSNAKMAYWTAAVYTYVLGYASPSRHGMLAWGWGWPTVDD